MREIKFRVWDKETRYMHICGENIHDEITFEDGTNKAYYYNLQNGCGSLNEDSDYILMQYTGFKDKNGQEIYEGDILQIDADKAWVRWNNKYGYFQLVPIGDYYFDSDVIGQVLEYEDVEVIGNIYNNPKLLKNRNIDKEMEI